MNTRFISLHAILLGAFVAGCAGYSDTPERAAPVPPPKAEKTKAELLVGTWKLVKRTPLNSKLHMTREYTQDGKVIKSISHPQDGSRVFIGTYKVDGDKLLQDFNNEAGLQTATIDSITADKLVISGTNDGERYVYEYERVRGK